jgi:hypothetical protein
MISCLSPKESNRVSLLQDFSHSTEIMLNPDRYLIPIAYIVKATVHFKDTYSRWPNNEMEFNNYLEEKGNEIGEGQTVDLSYIKNISFHEKSDQSVDVSFDTLFDHDDRENTKSSWVMNINEEIMSREKLTIKFNIGDESTEQTNRVVEEQLSNLLNTTDQEDSGNNILEIKLKKND